MQSYRGRILDVQAHRAACEIVRLEIEAEAQSAEAAHRVIHAEFSARYAASERDMDILSADMTAAFWVAHRLGYLARDFEAPLRPGYVELRLDGDAEKAADALARERGYYTTGRFDGPAPRCWSTTTYNVKTREFDQDGTTIRIEQRGAGESPFIWSYLAYLVVGATGEPTVTVEKRCELIRAAWRAAKDEGCRSLRVAVSGSVYLETWKRKLRFATHPQTERAEEWIDVLL